MVKSVVTTAHPSYDANKVSKRFPRSSIKFPHLLYVNDKTLSWTIENWCYDEFGEDTWTLRRAAETVVLMFKEQNQAMLAYMRWAG